jgi:hypothetical protein
MLKTRKLIPLPPKSLIIVFGVISLLSLMVILLGTYKPLSTSSGVYMVRCIFEPGQKEKANALYNDLKKKKLEVNMTGKPYTETKGYTASTVFSVRNKSVAEANKKLLIEAGFSVKIKPSVTTSDEILLQVGDIFEKKETAENMVEKVRSQAHINLKAEPYLVEIKGKSYVIVLLKVKNKYEAEEYENKLTKKGYNVEIEEVSN